MLVLLLKAFALPEIVERATQSLRRMIYYTQRGCTTKAQSSHRVRVSYPKTSTVASFSTISNEVAKFLAAKNQAQVNAYEICFKPTQPTKFFVIGVDLRCKIMKLSVIGKKKSIQKFAQAAEQICLRSVSPEGHFSSVRHNSGASRRGWREAPVCGGGMALSASVAGGPGPGGGPEGGPGEGPGAQSMEAKAGMAWAR